MSSYRGISRTYRPQTFADILGQDALVTTLKNALRSKKIAHAYLFCGTRGTGKTTMARVLAKALNCSNLSQEAEPCNLCSSCLEITQGKSLNVFEIDGASNRGIDDIRQLSEGLGYSALAQGCKIFIIDEVHMLTKEAFNALLKTLEEPPAGVKFFLATTEPHKIPPTILSRCQRFDLQRISNAKIMQKLAQIAQKQSIAYEEEALHKIALRSDGSMRVAESLLDQILCFSEETLTEKIISDSLATLPSDTFFEFDAAFDKKQLPFAFTLAQEIFSSGKDLIYFFECLLEHYRTILTIKLGLSLEEMTPSLQEKYKHSASFYTEEQALYILDYLVQWHEQASKAPFKRVLLEMVLLHILRSKHKISAADLVMRLEALQTTPLPSLTPPKEQPISLEDPLPIALNKPKQAVLEAAAPKKIEKPAPKVQDKPVSEPEISVEASPQTKLFQIQCETLMRFASVELEGTLTKE